VDVGGVVVLREFERRDAGGEPPPLDARLVLEAFREMAADPVRWDALLDVLPAGAATEALPHADLGAPAIEAAARRERRAGEGAMAKAADPGWIALSPAGKVLALNDAAAAAISGLAEAKVGAPLLWRHEENRANAADALARARAGEAQIILRLERPDEASFFVLASPASRLTSLTDLDALSLGRGCACLLFPAADPASRLWSAVRTSFGLTDAEVRLARRLRDGLSLQQAADSLGVSVNTVRNQLRAIFDKLGVQRQSDLVRALTELATLNVALDAPASDSSAAELAPPLRRLALHDGRRLSYREYGTAEGAPMLSFHEGLGSCLLPPGTDARCRELGLRLVAVDRPGFGQSDPRRDHSFATVADDMVELCDRLGLERPVIGAVASGAPFALHTAARLGRRARFALLCSGRPPRQARSAERNLFAGLRARWEAHPWLAESVFAIVRMRLSAGMTARMMRRAASFSPGDAAFLEANPWVFDYVCGYVGEALARSAKGPAQDLAAFRGADNLEPPSLVCPVVVWHGAEDVICPAGDLLDYLGAQVGETRLFEGVGSFMTLKYWDEVLRRACAPPP
jgi:pimeloyl-ACP methyl ester carboxylesterase/DNA-binding CsgD family transcriptional regulator